MRQGEIEKNIMHALSELKYVFLNFLQSLWIRVTIYSAKRKRKSIFNWSTEFLIKINIVQMKSHRNQINVTWLTKFCTPGEIYEGANLLETFKKTLAYSMLLKYVKTFVYKACDICFNYCSYFYRAQYLFIAQNMLYTVQCVKWIYCIHKYICV